MNKLKQTSTPSVAKKTLCETREDDLLCLLSQLHKTRDYGATNAHELKADILGGSVACVTYSGLGRPLDVFSLCVSDEVVEKDDVRLQTQHLPPHGQQQQSRVAVGEVVAGEFGVFKMHGLCGETSI